MQCETLICIVVVAVVDVEINCKTVRSALFRFHWLFGSLPFVQGESVCARAAEQLAQQFVLGS